MCQRFGYTRVLNMPLVFNIPWFWICQGHTGSRICLNNSWIYLNMSNYLWICLNMREYSWICLNMPGWLLLYISAFPHLFCNAFSAWICDYLFERLQETRGYSLRKHEAAFLKRQNLIFSIVAGSISFVFCFRLNIFKSKI